MSICDKMVVMKLGVVQQFGEPQAIYDNPDNLFVANFLGTPPINVFTGEIKDGKVYIGEEVIMETSQPDQPIYVGIRPEGFIYAEEGVLSLTKEYIEVMGRDKTIVSVHENSVKPSVRCIVDADVKLADQPVLRFNLRSNKVFLFNRDDEMRLR
jgi:multiple sugar transport system ATP-binding protein